jgi:hypothetical protein
VYCYRACLLHAMATTCACNSPHCVLLGQMNLLGVICEYVVLVVVVVRCELKLRSKSTYRNRPITGTNWKMKIKKPNIAKKPALVIINKYCYICPRRDSDDDC